MLWYESTVESSVSLCRSLLADKPDLLKRFDDVLTAKRLGFSAERDVIASGLVSQSEATAELEWLKEFLQNVHHRNLALGVAHRVRVHPAGSSRTNERSAHSTGADKEKRNGHSSTNDREASPNETIVSERAQNHTLTTDRQQQEDTDTSDVSNATLVTTESPQHDESPSIRERSGSTSEKVSKQLQSDQSRGSRTNPRGIIAGNRTPRKLRNRQKRVTFDVPPEKKTAAPVEEPKYCICHRPSFGEMVACDNPKCPYEWFHLSCVNLKKLPTSQQWFCPDCRKKLKETAKTRISKPNSSQRRNRSGRFA